MTEKLYDNNSYLSEFDCKVVSLHREDDFIQIETDRTAFFPEGGGQTSDIGFLGGIRVEDVQIVGGKIIHFVENSDDNAEKLTVCTNLHGKIDMKKRFSDMQQHSGEHIFSGTVHKLYGYNNVGFHLGTLVVTMDFDGVLEREDICKVENLVNKAIWDDIEIKTIFPKAEELSNYEYRSKIEIEGQVRLVEIPGIDLCACCAPHVKRTGEIGIVKVTAFEHYKGGTRVSILCGERALSHIQNMMEQNRLVSGLTSAKQGETAQAVKRLKEEIESLNYENVGLKRELLAIKAQNVTPQERILIFDTSLNGKALQEFAVSIMDKGEDFSAVFGGEEDNYRYCIVSRSRDLQPIAVKIREKLGGKGGGRPDIIQGSVSAKKSDIELLLKKHIKNIPED